MNAAKHSRIKADITFTQGVWEVVIFVGDHSEHKSFPNEDQARAYGAARIEQLRLGKSKSQIDGSVT